MVLYQKWYIPKVVSMYHNWYFNHFSYTKLVFYQKWYIPYLVCVYQNWYFTYTNFGTRGVLGVSPNKICSLYTQNAYLAISLTAYISRIWDVVLNGYF